MKITEEQIKAAYVVAKRFYAKEITVAEGTRELVQDYGLNHSSAAYYISNVRYLLLGKQYTRTMNKFATDYLLGMIHRDFDLEALDKAVGAVEKHVAYYENLRPGTTKAIHTIAKKYRAIVDGTKQAFLITWNPQQGRWHDMPIASTLTLSGGLYTDWWGVRSKSVTIGSRLFLLRQGVEPKGIVGSGWATSAPRLRTPPEPGRISHIVDVVFDMMLEPDKYPPLDWRTFTMPPLSEVHWTTQSSGISVPNELEAEWQQHVKKVLGYLPDALSENVIDPEEMLFPEGRGSYRLHRQIERNRKLVKAAKAKAKQEGRLYCWVCDFDFAKCYGDRGEGFIEAHHTIPVSQLGENATTRLEDVAMVCSNCHRMLHRTPWLSIEGLRDICIKQSS